MFEFGKCFLKPLKRPYAEQFITEVTPPD